MRVKSSQAVPGCILLKDVIGKTGRPIITKQTILTEEHLVVLRKFLIENIYVSSQLDDGSPFMAQSPTTQTNKSTNITTPSLENLKKTVHLFKQQFMTWKVQQKIDIASLRNIMLPLFEQARQLDVSCLINDRQILQEDTFYAKQVFKSVLAIILAKLVKCEQVEKNQIGLAAILSDSGMTKYDEDIYENTKGLFDNHRTDIIHHPIYSYRLIENSPLLTNATKISILQHHERIDGTGYPFKLLDNKIHRFAKIIAASDEFIRALAYYLTDSKDPIKQAIIHMQKEYSSQLDQQIMSILISQLIENH